MNLKTGHCKDCGKEIWWFNEGKENHPLNKKARRVVVDIGGNAFWTTGYESNLDTWEFRWKK